MLVAISRAIGFVVAFLLGVALGAWVGAYLAAPTINVIQIAPKRTVWTHG